MQLAAGGWQDGVCMHMRSLLLSLSSPLLGRHGADPLPPLLAGADFLSMEAFPVNVSLSLLKASYPFAYR